MPAVLKVTKASLRRFLLEQQGLKQDRSKTKTMQQEDVLNVIKRMECVQLDPVAAVERNQHLSLFARIPQYEPKDLEQLLLQRQVFEYFANAACVIPMQDYPLFEIVRKRIKKQLQPELDKLSAEAKEVLRQLEREGPLPSKAFVSTKRVHGYWDNTDAKTKITSHALNLLNDTGQIQVVSRQGTTRYFDILERAIPQDILDNAKKLSDIDAQMGLADKYMRAYRVFDPGDPRFGWQKMSRQERQQCLNSRLEQGVVTALEVDGVKKGYFILTEDVDTLLKHEMHGLEKDSAEIRGIHFLPPLDNLLWRRERIEDLFDFIYTWEVYIPAAKRKFGYYAMPILADDKIIGRIDPRLDRSRAQLNIPLLQIEPGIRWTKKLRNQMVRALHHFAQFHQAELGTIEKTIPNELPLL